MVELEKTRMVQDEAIKDIKMYLEFAMDRFDVLPDDDEELNEIWQLIKAARMKMEDF